MDVSTTSIAITPVAAGKLRSLMEEKQLAGSYALRVFVTGGGCSGLQYGMTFDDQTREGDVELEESGLRILVDPISLRYMQGASIDYVDSMMGGGFKIDNPNAVSSCGCGHSFRTSGAEGAHAGGGGCGGGCGH